ncbi:alpha/beta-hydrolase [Mycena latifolia]|nr:alpha/beta-hydrolase [Mycena latifolia]
MTKTSIAIPSLTPGWSIDAWSFIPSGTPGPHPVIVMAHGLGCNKLLGLAAYAEEFCAAGYACLIFDYRRWGASDGTRRNAFYLSEQQEDYRTVVKYARLQPEFDPLRVILWGFSFGGGHVLTLASESSLNVAASMAIDAYCGTQEKIQFDRWFITLFALGLVDLITDLLHLPPVYIPVVAPPGQFACMPQPSALPGFRSVTQAPSDFPNQIAASIFFRAVGHEPMKTLHLIQRPILLTASERDQLCPPAHIKKASLVASTAELVEFPGSHFDLFKGNTDWDQAIETQLAFLRKHVPV